METDGDVFVVTLSRPPEVTEELASAQRAALKTLTERGLLLVAGPFPDGSGGMAIMRALSLAEAEATYAATPLAAGGHVTWSVRRWTPRAGTMLPQFLEK